MGISEQEKKAEIFAKKVEKILLKPKNFSGKKRGVLDPGKERKRHKKTLEEIEKILSKEMNFIHTQDREEAALELMDLVQKQGGSTTGENPIKRWFLERPENVIESFKEFARDKMFKELDETNNRVRQNLKDLTLTARARTTAEKGLREALDEIRSIGRGRDKNAQAQPTSPGGGAVGGIYTSTSFGGGRDKGGDEKMPESNLEQNSKYPQGLTKMTTPGVKRSDLAKNKIEREKKNRELSEKVEGARVSKDKTRKKPKAKLPLKDRTPKLPQFRR